MPDGGASFPNPLRFAARLRLRTAHFGLFIFSLCASGLGMTLPITSLKNRADFLRLRNGRKAMSAYFILRGALSDIPTQTCARVGYTVTTKCGNAVVRNRTKRRLRAIVRELFPAAARAGYDYIIIARNDAKPSAADVAYDELRRAMSRAMANIHPHA